MPTTVLPEHISELRWLVDELSQELDILATTSYPRVHRFLMRTLAIKIIKVAAQVRGNLTEHPQDQQGPSNGARLIEQSA
jgi:hypothetical protein